MYGIIKDPISQFGVNKLRWNWQRVLKSAIDPQQQPESGYHTFKPSVDLIVKEFALNVVQFIHRFSVRFDRRPESLIDSFSLLCQPFGKGHLLVE
jgi:hypothetical protein